MASFSVVQKAKTRQPTAPGTRISQDMDVWSKSPKEKPGSRSAPGAIRHDGISQMMPCFHE
jgi:hypothetical protein